MFAVTLGLLWTPASSVAVSPSWLLWVLVPVVTVAVVGAFSEPFVMEVFLSESGFLDSVKVLVIIIVLAPTVPLVVTVFRGVVESPLVPFVWFEATVSVTRRTTQNQVRVSAGSFSLHALPILPQDPGALLLSLPFEGLGPCAQTFLGFKKPQRGRLRVKQEIEGNAEEKAWATSPAAYGSPR